MRHLLIILIALLGHISAIELMKDSEFGKCDNKMVRQNFYKELDCQGGIDKPKTDSINAKKWINFDYEGCSFAREKFEGYYSKHSCTDKKMKKIFYTDNNCTKSADISPSIMVFDDCENLSQTSQMYTNHISTALDIAHRMDDGK